MSILFSYMSNLNEIIDYLSKELAFDNFHEESFNGLQIEGSAKVQNVSVAVDVGISVVKEAIAQKADMLIVHHGLIWDSPLPITKGNKEIVKLLLDNNISLFAAHLPLDAHLKLGNNACIHRLLQTSEPIPCFLYKGKEIGIKAFNHKELSLSEISDCLYKLPRAKNEKILCFNFGPKIPRYLGIVSGSGANALEHCHRFDIDTLITGEPKHFTFHFAKDNNLNIIFAGHYASETLGVQEIGKTLKEVFNINWSFINIPTGI